ncbi:glycerol-3-phosphate dehydrogenase [Candidatus Methanoperedens nitroreducens]|uniref:Glycerol-3-phosphate dehydrogenase n=2 Tax=Candidatus Methanoperedens nitratireducens TaxID=1392998 RepID=A0A062V970_9EURY|nr:glycerol-3-phosphate dehydrogenase [Candidatus Methanoperedens nitroreducens]
MARLGKKSYDLLIIGGGIYGAAAVWDAASRGLSVALIDKGDFGSRNSSNSQKTIHGGLRYMQHGDLWRMRKSACERTTLMRIAPHLVHPMPCLIPTYGNLMRGIMPLALKIYDLVNFDRNQLKDTQKHIPGGRVVSKEEFLRLIPGAQDNGLTGGVIWYDAQVYNTERMVLSFIKSAENAGADVANYIEATGFLKNGNRIRGIKARDLINNSELEIQAKVILNASGPWVDNVLGSLGNPQRRRIVLSKMLILVSNRLLVQDYAFGISFQKKFKDDDAVINKGYRLLFISPWRNYSLIGTAQMPYQGDPEDLKITEADIQRFIEEVNEAYPHAALTRKDVSFFYGGLLPVDGVNRNGDVNLIKHYKIYDHKQEGIEGLISVMGVKYTEGRYVAQRAIDLVFKKLGIKSPECTTMRNPIHGGSIEKFNDFLGNAIENRPRGLSEEIIRHLVYNYGSEYIKILKYIDENPCYGEKMSIRSDVIRAEILHGIREEMAQKLGDVVLRRTEMGTAEYPGEEALKACASIMAEELGWNESRVKRELEEVKEIYTPGA